MTAPGLANRDAAHAQRRAADPAASAWVAASAGSGKTKVLTDRVLRLLLAGTPPSRILCLTFTKAAAAEMAIRLNGRLALWATCPDVALRRDLEDLCGDLADDDRLGHARRLFARVLDAPGGLAIQTIHAFCQAVLRRFPLEAGIAPHFEVMDERTAAEMLDAAREGLLAHARRGDDPALAAALAEISGRIHEEQFAGLMATLVSERGRLRRMLEGAGGVEGLVARIHRHLGLAVGDTEADICAAASRDAACDAAALRRAAAVLRGGSKTDAERGATIDTWLADPDRRVAGLPAYSLAFLTAKHTVRAALLTKPLRTAHPDAAAVLEAEAARLLAVRDRCRAVRTACGTAALVRLGGALLARYEAAKAARGLLDYDDLILATRKLLIDPGAAWVLFKLDGGIDHILIDEAQDTNPEQWEVVEALAAEFFAGEGARETVRTLFAVGDRKQSIFSFQRAEPARFEAMRAHFRARAAEADRGWADVALDVSFRSAAAVLQAVDAVFAGPAGDGVVIDGDGPLRHVAHRAGHAGRVELWPPVGPEAIDRSDPWTAPLAYDSVRSPDARLADHIAETVRAWIAGGERLESRGRPVRAGDVMVLVRRRTGFVDALVRALKARDVPVAGIDRMVLTEQLAVMDLIALGEFLLLPEDDLTLATVLRSPLVGFDEDALFALAHDRGDASLRRRLANAAAAAPGSPFATAETFLSDLLARADFVPPHELYADLLGRGGGRARLVSRLGVEANDPIDEFLALALAHGRVNVPSLQGFLHWLRAGQAEVKRDLEQGGRDEVRIITVHGAKGLQAPIVFLPDTTSLPTDRGATLHWIEADGGMPLWSARADDRDPVSAAAQAEATARREQEYRRLLYVGLTRAEDRLYVCGWHGARGVAAGSWHALVADALAGMDVVERFDFHARYPDAWAGEGIAVANPQEAAPEPGRVPVAGGASDEPLPAWATLPAPAAEPTGPAVAPSHREDEPEPPVFSPFGRDDGRRFRRGLLIHRLLQSLPDVEPGRREAACRRFLDRSRDLDPTQRDEIARETLAVLDDRSFSPLFAPGSRAEMPIGGVVGGRTISGQIDRLAVTAEAVLIVDYKSQRPPPDRAEGVSAAYLRQMAAYRALVRRIWPDRPVRCALLWTESPRLMPLPDALLDRYEG